MSQPAREGLSPRQHPLVDADYRRMVDALGDYALFMLDPQGRIRSWNRGAAQLKGYTEDDILGRSFEVFYPQDKIDIGYPQHELAEALRLGRFEDEGWRLRKDGSRFWANVVITPVRDDSGSHVGFVKVTRDLTERRAAEEALRQSEERFRLMVECVRDYAIFMLDTKGHITSWNLGAQLNKGHTAEEIMGRHFSVFYPQQKIDEGWPETELEYALRDGRFEDEGWRVRKDGSRFWASVVITAVFDEHGEHRGFAKVTRDLTERRRIDALEAESRQLTQFVAILGHELRNPLASISNVSQILDYEDLSFSERLQTLRGVLSRQVTQLRRLVDDLLDVGRIMNGRIHLEHVPVCMQAVVAEAVEGMSDLCRQKGQDLDSRVEATPVWVSGDRLRLVQVLANLLQNAGKFTPEGGRIRVVLGQRDGHAELSVSDTGQGIPPQELQYIFKLFAQGSDVEIGKGMEGLGIGLSLVHQIVYGHDGEVSAFSSGVPGEGAEFVVRLPLIAAPKGHEAGARK